jgi:hypothetical protein
MKEVQALGFRPVQTEFVFVTAGCNMRVAACLHIGIHADGYRRRLAAFFDLPRRLFHKNFEFCLRFNVEEQDPRVSAVLRSSIS